MTVLTRLTAWTGKLSASQTGAGHRPFLDPSIRSTGSTGSLGCAAQETAQPPGTPAQAWLVSVLVLGAGLLLAHLAPDVFLRLLGVPAAWLASLWLRGPLVFDVDGYWILNARQAVHVTNACNGAGFFALLSALTVPYWRRGLSRRAGCMQGCLLLTAPYTGAVLANGVRIIVVWYAAHVTHVLAIPAWAATIHYISGLLVFFLFLVGYHICMERIYHERITS